eukprot:SAG25_NODE_250_length_11019_cov_7.950092_6_plen_341_part_00
MNTWVARRAWMADQTRARMPRRNEDAVGDGCDASAGSSFTEQPAWSLQPWEAQAVRTGLDRNTRCREAARILRGYAGTRGTEGTCRSPILAAPEWEYLVDTVCQLAVLAIRTTDELVHGSTVLLDAGMDSMSAVGFLDEVAALLPSAATAAAAAAASWTVDMLAEHPTPQLLVTALLGVLAAGVAEPKPEQDAEAAAAAASASAAAAAQEEVAAAAHAPSPTQGSSRGVVVACGTADHRRRRQPHHRRRGKQPKLPKAERPSKAERRARYSQPQHNSSSRPGGPAQALARSAATVGGVLHCAKHGDAEALVALAEAGRQEADGAEDCGGGGGGKSLLPRV